MKTIELKVTTSHRAWYKNGLEHRDGGRPAFIWHNGWSEMKGFTESLYKFSKKIHERTSRGGANYIVTSPEIYKNIIKNV